LESLRNIIGPEKNQRKAFLEGELNAAEGVSRVRGEGVKIARGIK